MWLTAHAPFPRNKEKKKARVTFQRGVIEGQILPLQLFCSRPGQAWGSHTVSTLFPPHGPVTRGDVEAMARLPLAPSNGEKSRRVLCLPLHRVCLKCPMSFPIGVARDFFSTFLSDPRDQEMVNKPPLSGISRATRPATMSPLCSPAYTLPPGTCLMTCDERPNLK